MFHPRTKKQISVHKLIGGATSTFATKAEAAAAEAEARKVIAAGYVAITVRDWWQEWTTSAHWQRAAESTNIHYRERTAAFVEAYGDRPISAIDDLVAIEWLRGGKNKATVPALRVMFNNAMSVTAGRLVSRNPFAGLGLSAGPGRSKMVPPDQVVAANLVDLADELTPATFAAYLHFSQFEGTRPGETDALLWEKIDFQAGTVLIDQQYIAKTRKMTLPKHHIVRKIALTAPARERLAHVPRVSPYVFTTLRGTHYTPTSRIHHWNRVRAPAGLGNADFYLCTRHYFGWYAWNILRLTPEDIAAQFGHQDGGLLVRKVYGHFDNALARERIAEAFENAPAAPISITRERQTGEERRACDRRPPPGAK